MSKNRVRVPLSTIEFFIGEADKLWRIVSKNWGPKPVPPWLSTILDLLLISAQVMQREYLRRSLAIGLGRHVVMLH